MRVHVESIDAKIVCSQVKRLEDLGESKNSAITENDLVIWRPFHFRLDKSEQVLLIHAAGVMDVGVHFSNIVKVTAECILEPPV